MKRLQELKNIKKWLEDVKGDDHDYLPTIKAVMNAYRKKKLDWNLGLVTYWFDGKQLCQPRLHDLEVVKILTKEPLYSRAIWVEGVSHS